MKTRWVPLAILAVLCFACGVLISRKLGDLFDAGGPTVVVPTDPAKMEKARVDATPGLLERVQLGRVKPTEVRIGTEPSKAGERRVADYCQAAAAPYLAQTSANPGLSMGPVPDSATKRGTGPRILPDFGGKVSRSKVALQSTLSDGTPWAADYKVRGRWTFVSTDSSVNVRSERLWSRLARGLVRCGIMAGAGAGVGYLVQSQQPLQGAARGAAIGGGTCAVMEIAF